MLESLRGRLTGSMVRDLLLLKISLLKNIHPCNTHVSFSLMYQLFTPRVLPKMLFTKDYYYYIKSIPLAAMILPIYFFEQLPSIKFVLFNSGHWANAIGVNICVNIFPESS